MPLYRYVGGAYARTLPVPMMNIVNGGAHADNPIDIQEFMIHAGRRRARSPTRVRMGAEIFHTLKKALKDAGPQHQCRRRGRLRAQPAARPTRRSTSSCKAMRGGRLSSPARTSPSRSTAPRPSSSRTASTSCEGEGRTLDAGRAWSTICADAGRDAIRSSRSRTACAEDDWDGWKLLTDRLGGKVQLVGDDLFVTNSERLREGIDARHGQRHPGEGQPDRHADRDARGRRDGAPRRLHAR
jgi:enolase